MHDLFNMLWCEARKAIRSRMPLWTLLGALFIPLGVAFVFFVAKNPEISRNLGLVGAKANLLVYGKADWLFYLGFFGQIIAAGGYFLFVLIISWTFGREFVDGTLKDMLAVPIRRSSILLAKFVVTIVWSMTMVVLMFAEYLILGALLRLPNGSFNVILQNSLPSLVCAFLTIVLVLPFAFFASIGRGYLAPIGAAIFVLMLTNLVVVVGRGDYFPWSIPALYLQSKSPLSATSLLIVLLTGLAGMLITGLWWTYSDQNR